MNKPMKTSVRDCVVDALDSRRVTATQLSAMSGVSYSVITNLKRRPDSSTSVENGQALLDALTKLDLLPPGVDVEDGPRTPQSGDALVPVFDVQASAGFGSLVDYEEQTHSLAFPPDYLKKLTSSSAKKLVIISTSGDSMEPTLLDHDIVLIDTSKTHLGYEGMFVLRHNDTLLVKRAGMAATAGNVTLLSDNKAYPPVEAQLADLHVVGKVLWYGRKV